MSIPSTRHLHGGKWSPEEESYAAALMEAFTVGELPSSDCAEGMSLRKYLAKKLMCSPKRVSKKFEGTGYNGKQVYFKKDRAKCTSNPFLEAARQSRLQLMERNFLTTLAAMKHVDAPGSVRLVSENLTPETFASAPPLLDSGFAQQSSNALVSRPVRGTSDSKFLQARSDLSLLIQQRDMLNKVLSNAQHESVCLQPMVERKFRASITRELVLQDNRNAFEQRARNDHIRQAVVAPSLAKQHQASFNVSSLPGFLEYHRLPHPGGNTGDPSGGLAFSYLHRQLAVSRQLYPVASPTVTGKHSLETRDGEPSVKRARGSLWNTHAHDGRASFGTNT